MKVIGRSKGRSFVVPISYTFEGSKVAQALDIEVQRAEYIKKHQLARGQIGSSPQLLSSVPINCGKLHNPLCELLQSKCSAICPCRLHLL